MESSPITSQPIEGEQLDKVTDFLFLGPKITVDVHCIQKIGRWLFLGRKAMTNKTKHIRQKQRHHFDDRGPCSQAY